MSLSMTFYPLLSNGSMLGILFSFSLRRQVAAINHLANKGLYFWDYGNAFLLEAGRAGNVWLFFLLFGLQVQSIVKVICHAIKSINH